MAGKDVNGRHELDQWKKALLSRNFDLVHTQLLMLDGDVTPSERVQLVKEIFDTVQQLEELTTGTLQSKIIKQENNAMSEQENSSRDSPDEQPVNIKAPFRKYRTDSEDEDYLPRPSTRKVRGGEIQNLPKDELGRRFVKCPVCVQPHAVDKKKVVRYDWYCNSCRLFKLRLVRSNEAGNRLPSCLHKGKRISSCKGCRRFRLEKFWFEKRREHTYEIPLMDTEEPSDWEVDQLDI